MADTSRKIVLPLIDVAGMPSERGYQYGVQAKTFIEKSLNNYAGAFATKDITWTQACSIARSYQSHLSESLQDLLDEITGIAKGAGVDTEDIMALNCRSEILYSQNVGDDVATDGCTGAIVLPGATASGHMLHGQNWDWHDECAESSVVLRIRSNHGPDILTQTEAGVLARAGINSRGIALTGNFLKCDRDNVPGGTPSPFIRRRILEQEYFSEAIYQAVAAPKSISNNMMISDAEGEAVNLETVPGESFWILPENDLLVHANHFESAAAQAKVVDLGIRFAPCTLYRSKRVRENLLKYKGHIEIDHLKEAFADKYGRPYGVCAEPAICSEGRVWSTVATILIDVTLREMWIAVRPYDEPEFIQYKLNA